MVSLAHYDAIHTSDKNMKGNVLLDSCNLNHAVMLLARLKISLVNKNIAAQQKIFYDLC